MIEIKHHRWYYFLNNEQKENLLTSSDYVDGNLIVGMDYGGTKVFSSFTDYKDLVLYMKQFEKDKRHFYEIIMGHKKQKPHFDIDIDSTKELYGMFHKDALLDTVASNVVSQLIESIVAIIPTSIIRTYTSHGDKKRSYHVVVTNFHHLNNKDAKDFYKNVKTMMDKEYSIFVDESVYSPTQQFRIIGCTKVGSDRVKIPDFDSDLSSMELLEESLISVVHSSSWLVRIPKNMDDIVKAQNFEDQTSTEYAKKVMKRLYKLYEELEDGFNITIVRRNIILLKRRIPTYCRLCQRTHEHENPFITTSTYTYPSKDGKGKTVEKAFFRCRRSDIPLSFNMDDTKDAFKAVAIDILMDKKVEIKEKESENKQLFESALIFD